MLRVIPRSNVPSKAHPGRVLKTGEQSVGFPGNLVLKTASGKEPGTCPPRFSYRASDNTYYVEV